jgi:hypothetical protein
MSKQTIHASKVSLSASDAIGILEELLFIRELSIIVPVSDTTYNVQTFIQNIDATLSATAIQI